MEVIHSDIPNEDHLKGLTPEEKEFIRKFAKLSADIILKDRHEKQHRTKGES